MHYFGDHRARIADALRWWPEWRVAVVVVLAWVALLAGVASHGGATVAAERTPTHEHATGAAVRTPEIVHASSNSVLSVLPAWVLMVVAMMAPVTLPAVRHVGLNSIRRRRQWAMTLYFTVYVGVWVAFGLVALTAERFLRETLGLDSRALLVLLLAVAGGWQLARVKRRALLRCRRTVPLRPVGIRADAGCARFAWQQGWRCVTSCWALMAVMVVVGHSWLVWMTALTALVMVEELTFLGPRVLRPSAAALAVASGLVALGV